MDSSGRRKPSRAEQAAAGQRFIRLRGLPRSTSDGALRALFGTCSVQGIRLDIGPRAGHPDKVRQALVAFRTPEHAAAALQLKEVKLGTQTITIAPATDVDWHGAAASASSTSAPKDTSAEYVLSLMAGPLAFRSMDASARKALEDDLHDLGRERHVCADMVSKTTSCIDRLTIRGKQDVVQAVKDEFVKLLEFHVSKNGASANKRQKTSACTANDATASRQAAAPVPAAPAPEAPGPEALPEAPGPLLPTRKRVYGFDAWAGAREAFSGGVKRRLDDADAHDRSLQHQPSRVKCGDGRPVATPKVSAPKACSTTARKTNSTLVTGTTSPRVDEALSVGEYVIEKPVTVRESSSLSSLQVCMLEAGTVVEVISVVFKEGKWRAQLKDPPGWISLQCQIADGTIRWAHKASGSQLRCEELGKDVDGKVPQPPQPPRPLAASGTVPTPPPRPLAASGTVPPPPPPPRVPSPPPPPLAASGTLPQVPLAVEPGRLPPGRLPSPPPPPGGSLPPGRLPPRLAASGLCNKGVGGPSPPTEPPPAKLLPMPPAEPPPAKLLHFVDPAERKDAPAGTTAKPRMPTPSEIVRKTAPASNAEALGDGAAAPTARAATVRQGNGTQDKMKIFYLPKMMNGCPIMLQRTGGTWLADNTQLKSASPGVAYRKSKNSDDRVKDDAFLKWGTEIRGEDDGDWVKGFIQEDQCMRPDKPKKHCERAKSWGSDSTYWSKEWGGDWKYSSKAWVEKASASSEWQDAPPLNTATSNKEVKSNPSIPKSGPVLHLHGQAQQPTRRSLPGRARNADPAPAFGPKAIPRTPPSAGDTTAITTAEDRGTLAQEPSQALRAGGDEAPAGGAKKNEDGQGDSGTRVWI